MREGTRSDLFGESQVFKALGARRSPQVKMSLLQDLKLEVVHLANKQMVSEHMKELSKCFQNATSQMLVLDNLSSRYPGLMKNMGVRCLKRLDQPTEFVGLIMMDRSIRCSTRSSSSFVAVCCLYCCCTSADMRMLMCRFYVSVLVIDKALQRHGLGTYLLKDTEQWLQKYFEVSSIQLNIFKHSPSWVPEMYQKLGYYFPECGSKLIFPVDYDWEAPMLKEL